MGFPHAMMVTTANVTDRNGAVEMIEYYRDVTDNLRNVQKCLLDGGYTGENFANTIKSLIMRKLKL